MLCRIFLKFIFDVIYLAAFPRCAPSLALNFFSFGINFHSELTCLASGSTSALLDVTLSIENSVIGKPEAERDLSVVCFYFVCKCSPCISFSKENPLLFFRSGKYYVK